LNQFSEAYSDSINILQVARGRFHTGKKTLEQLQAKLDPLLNELTPEIVASITGYPFILDALSALDSF
jgi:hypothetical protein